MPGHYDDSNLNTVIKGTPGFNSHFNLMHLLLTILSLLPLFSKIPKAFSRSALKFVPVKYNTLQICISTCRNDHEFNNVCMYM